MKTIQEYEKHNKKVLEEMKSHDFSLVLTPILFDCFEKGGTNMNNLLVDLPLKVNCVD